MWSRSVMVSVCRNDPEGSLDFAVGDMGCLSWVMVAYMYSY